MVPSRSILRGWRIAKEKASHKIGDRRCGMSTDFDLRCPRCRRVDSIDILAAIWVRLTHDGTDPDLGLVFLADFRQSGVALLTL